MEIHRFIQQYIDLETVIECEWANNMWIVKQMRYPTDRSTDRLTNQLMDTASYRGTWSHLKTFRWEISIMNDAKSSKFHFF